MKFSKNTIHKLIFHAVVGESVDGCELIDNGEWVFNENGPARNCVFKFENHYYTVLDSRPGGYYADYFRYSESFFDKLDCKEVFPEEVTKIVWKEKKP